MATVVVARAVGGVVRGTAATVGSSTAAGSWVGPLGSIAGFVAGVAVDMWLRGKTRGEVIRRVGAALESAQRQLEEGEPGRPGLRATYETLATDATRARVDARRRAFLEARP